MGKKRAEALLAKADKVLEEKGWIVGELYDEETGGHCALGAIGYARFGKRFDEACVERGLFDPMVLLREDPACRSAVELLANEILRASKRPQLIQVPAVWSGDGPYWDDPFSQATDEVVEYNDSSSRKGVRVRNRFAAFRVQPAPVVPVRKPVVEEMPVEHVKAAPATRQVVKSEVVG